MSESIPIPQEEPEKPKKSSNKRDLERNLGIIKYASIEATHLEPEMDWRKDGAYWDVYDSPLAEYDRSFKDVLEGKTFQQFIETHYTDKQGNLVGMELGGPGHNLFQGFKEGLFRETVGVTLNDIRKESDKKEDVTRNHQVIEADVFLRKPQMKGYEQFPVRQFRTIEDWVKQHGNPDIIIERMLGGLDMIRRKEIFLSILDRWYTLLSDEGTIFFEAPRNDTKGVTLLEYSKELESIENVATLEFRSNKNQNPIRPFAYIRKLKGAPTSLRELFNKQ